MTCQLVGRLVGGSLFSSGEEQEHRRGQDLEPGGRCNHREHAEVVGGESGKSRGGQHGDRVEAVDAPDGPGSKGLRGVEDEHGVGGNPGDGEWVAAQGENTEGRAWGRMEARARRSAPEIAVPVATGSRYPNRLTVKAIVGPARSAVTANALLTMPMNAELVPITPSIRTGNRPLSAPSLQASSIWSAATPRAVGWVTTRRTPASQSERRLARNRAGGSAQPSAEGPTRAQPISPAPPLSRRPRVRSQQRSSGFRREQDRRAG